MLFKEWLLVEGKVEVGQIIKTSDKRNGQEQELKVVAIKGDKVYLFPTAYGEPGSNLYGSIIMPLASVAHFVNDLDGQVHMDKRTGDSAIDAVLDGKGEFLGKGDDGVVFAVGDEVVKMSTTVPYVPSNPGHRYPSEAARMIYDEVHNAKLLKQAGVPCILPYRLKILGDKAFLVHPKVQIIDKLSPDQLDQVRESIRAMHEAGWCYRDQMQVGLWNSKVYHYDLGKVVHKIDMHDAKNDMDALQLLYSRNGHPDLFVPVGMVLKDKWTDMTDKDGSAVWLAEKSAKQWDILMRDLDLYYPYIAKELPDQAHKYQAIKDTLKKPDVDDDADWS